MKAPPVIVPNLRQSFCVALLAAALFATSGCGVSLREEDGHQGPEQNARYEVSIGPSLATVELTPGADSVSFRTHLSVTCQGSEIPPGCDTFDPNWRGAGPLSMEVIVDDPHKSETDATVRLNVAGYLKLSSLVGSHLPVFATFTPRVPKGMRLTGRREFRVEITVPSPTADRQEEPAAKPRLVALPNEFRPFPGPGDPNPQQRIEIGYTGPPTDLLTPSLTGPGATKWIVSIPGGTPYPLIGNGDGPGVTVTFAGPSGGSSKATVTLRTKDVPTAKGTAVTIELGY